MSVGWDVVCSIVTAVAAVIALGISVVQIRISNKQQLLDRRHRLWVKAYGLMRLCKDNRSALEKREDGPEFANSFLFLYLTNNSYLHDIGPTVNHAQEQDWQLRFLAKMEELKEMALEIELVFKGHSAKALSVFVADYAELLMTMYQYQIMLESLDKVGKQFPFDLDQTISSVGEEKMREELDKAKDSLLDSFGKLSPCMVKGIISQCKISRFF